MLEKLKKSKDDRQFKEFVDAALAADTAQLLEEVVAAKQQEKKERIAREKAEGGELSRLELESERDGLIQEKAMLENRVSVLTTELGTVQSESAESISQLKGDVTANEFKASNLESRLDRIVSSLCVIAALVCSAALIVASEYLITKYQWTWLMNHPNSYALRSVGYIAVTAFLLGLFRSSWRKYFWWGTIGVVALLVALVTLLGGPGK
jgi:hypothetical protein